MERDIPAKDRTIPDIVIRRLPIYRRGLQHLLQQGQLTISSSDLANEIGVTAAQIRRDLSYFGRFGKQGKGYDVPSLVESIQQILNIDRRWDVGLAGFGHLGQAIADYGGFELSSFRIRAIFDRSPDLIGLQSARGVEVLSEDAISSEVRHLGIRMGVVAVPADQAQDVTDKFLEGGVEAILNYAPVTLHVPAGVWVREIDPISLMQSMTYYLDGKSEPDEIQGKFSTRLADVAGS
jgi:redox-sensing transcriptional repressor